MTVSLPHPMATTQRAGTLNEVGQLAQGGGTLPVVFVGVDAGRADAQGVGVGDVTAIVYARVGTSDADFEIVAALLSGEGFSHGA